VKFFAPKKCGYSHLKNPLPSGVARGARARFAGLGSASAHFLQSLKNERALNRILDQSMLKNAYFLKTKKLQKSPQRRAILPETPFASENYCYKTVITAL